MESTLYISKKYIRCTRRKWNSYKVVIKDDIKDEIFIKYEIVIDKIVKMNKSTCLYFF